MDPDLRASMYLNIISRITPQQRFSMIDAGLMPINLEETLKFLDGDSNPYLLSNLERLTKTVKPGKLFADIGHAQNNFNDPVPDVEWKEEYSKIYNE